MEILRCRCRDRTYRRSLPGNHCSSLIDRNKRTAVRGEFQPGKTSRMALEGPNLGSCFNVPEMYGMIAASCCDVDSVRRKGHGRNAPYLSGNTPNTPSVSYTPEFDGTIGKSCCQFAIRWRKAKRTAFFIRSVQHEHDFCSGILQHIDRTIGICYCQQAAIRRKSEGRDGGKTRLDRPKWNAGLKVRADDGASLASNGEFVCGWRDSQSPYRSFAQVQGLSGSIRKMIQSDRSLLIGSEHMMRVLTQFQNRRLPMEAVQWVASRSVP